MDFNDWYGEGHAKKNSRSLLDGGDAVYCHLFQLWGSGNDCHRQFCNVKRYRPPRGRTGISLFRVLVGVCY